jgi:L-threonylcarbamoyladenylate synthase
LSTEFYWKLLGARAVFQLSTKGGLPEAATNLFTGLRALDTSGARAIAVISIRVTVPRLAVDDRLTRAAASRR